MGNYDGDGYSLGGPFDVLTREDLKVVMQVLNGQSELEIMANRGVRAEADIPIPYELPITKNANPAYKGNLLTVAEKENPDSSPQFKPATVSNRETLLLKIWKSLRR